MVTAQTPQRFHSFKQMVRERGGVWYSRDVYFTQFRDGWSAAYMPDYPLRSSEDQAISYNWLSKAWHYTGTGQNNG